MILGQQAPLPLYHALRLPLYIVIERGAHHPPLPTVAYEVRDELKGMLW